MFKKGNKEAQKERIYQDTEEDLKRLDENLEKYVKYTEKEKKMPTISGLAYYLGFASRQSIYDYVKKDYECSYILKKVILQIEMLWEEKLSGQSVTGVIFWLKNRGWKDEYTHNNKNENKNIDYNDIKDDEAKKKLFEELMED